MGSTAAKRPWLAAVLSILVTGLGHVYLRRWARAVAWIGLAIFSAWMFVPNGAVQDARMVELLPVSVVLLTCVLDAYLVAKAHNRSLDVATANRCPECHHEVDDELAFCWNCAADLDADARP